jgi:photosystem II stability/assembly factor-like uncharacterized protein
MKIRACLALAATLALLTACSGVTPYAAASAGRAGPSVTVTPDTGSSTVPAAAATELARSSLLGVSWVSAAAGWALAAQPCAVGTCARLARTTDGGRHWRLLPNPPAAVQDDFIPCTARACVSQVSFASAAVGYLWGPSLLVTTDGGRTWRAQPGPLTETLTTVAGRVYRVAYTSDGCPGPCLPSLEEARPGSAAWRTIIRRLAEPDRSDSAQIAAWGPDLLVALFGSLAGPVSAHATVYRSTDDGARWQQAADPCSGRGIRPPDQEEDLMAVAAAAGGFFAGLCLPHGGPTGDGLVITSADAGAAWRPVATEPRGQRLSLLAAASPGTIAVATGPLGGGGVYTSWLEVTTDGGRHWVTAATDTSGFAADGIPAWLGFQTARAGHWIGDPHGIWTTTDGGRRWSRTAFR